jgi:outer membrane protein assembly factor BamB
MNARRLLILAAGLASLVLAAADWPQWRGLNRDAKVTDFKAPATWPKELKQQWKVEIGDGAATPALVGDKLYVFSRQGGDEVLRCLVAGTGKEIWQAKYSTQGSTDPGGFVGPRSTPAVAEGKVVTVSARGMISCFDAATGEKVWSKDEFRSWPQFFASSSPIIVDGLCIAQLGGNNGAVVAYELATGTEKWKVADLPTAYASPVLLTAGGTKLVIGQVSDGVVAIDVSSGKKVWEKFFEMSGGRPYRAVTPIVEADALIHLGDGPTTAIKLEKQGDKFEGKVLWTSSENRVEFNTPVLKDGMLFGLTGGRVGGMSHQFFCFDVQSGKTAWATPAPRISAAVGDKAGGDKAGGGKGRGKGFGKGGGGIRADAGYGSIVDAGSVLLALTPSSQLIVFAPSDKEFKQLASYKVSDDPSYAYPVVTGNRVFIKDRNSVALWTIE